MRRFAVVVGAFALTLALLPVGAVQADAAAGSYIVVLRSGDPGAVAAEHSRSQGAQVSHVYRHALRGYAARMSAQAAARVARDARVASVEADGAVTTQSTTQDNATWGLDRVDQRERPLDTRYTYTTDAAGVHAYIIDTGIRATHHDFGVRVAAGYSTISDSRGTDDCNGHGTHVAGTVGGAQWGVAKGVTLVPIRVLNCQGSGTWSGVIAGVDWVTANAQKPAVANMSLGGGANTSVDTAVRNSVAAGITYAVAAGNDNKNACNYSPARVAEALTVGSATSTDARSSFSNVGSCVNIFAPGSSITSAWHSSNSATNTISGTSMASPHVAGIAALYLAANPAAAPAAVKTAVEANATPGVVANPGSGSPNRLAHSLWEDQDDGGGPAPVDPNPDPDPADPVTKPISGTPSSAAANRHLNVTVTVEPVVGGASVSIKLVRRSDGHTLTGSGTTGSDGTVTWRVNQAASTCYDVSVTGITATGYHWDDQANSTPTGSCQSS